MAKETRSTSILLWAACYTLWLTFFAAGFLLLIQTRLVLLGLGRLTPANYWMLSAIDRYAILFLGLVWLVLGLALEPYLRNGVHKGTFWSRAGRVTAWFVGLLALLIGFRFLLG